MPHPFLNFLVPPLICIGISSLRWSNFTIIDSPACCLFVCHVLLLLFFFSLFLRRQLFLLFSYCTTLLFFRRPEAYDSGMLEDSGLLHQLQLHATPLLGRQCASWRSGISFKGATSRAAQKCCFDTSDSSILHLYESR